MSNYDRESLKDFGEQIVVSAEVVNGTGGVQFFAREHAGEDASSVIFNFTPDQALDLARLLSRQAHQAMRVKWNEANINSG